MKKTLETRVISLATLSTLIGNFDCNINLIADNTSTQIYTENNLFKIIGEEENAILAKKVLEKLAEVIEQGENIDKNDILERDWF